MAELSSLVTATCRIAVFGNWSYSPFEASSCRLRRRPSLRRKSIFFHFSLEVASGVFTSRLVACYIHRGSVTLVETRLVVRQREIGPESIDS